MAGVVLMLALGILLVVGLVGMILMLIFIGVGTLFFLGFLVLLGIGAFAIHPLVGILFLILVLAAMFGEEKTGKC